MNLPEKKSSFKHTGVIFHFFSILLFLTVVCTEISPAFAGTDGTAPEEERQGDAVITDFFSDHELSDATVRFEQPLENVSLVFTLSSGKKLLKSETFLLGPVEKGQEVTKVLFWGLEEGFGKNRDSEKIETLIQHSFL